MQSDNDLMFLLIDQKLMTCLANFYVHNWSRDSLVEERRQPDKELVA